MMKGTLQRVWRAGLHAVEWPAERWKAILGYSGGGAAFLVVAQQAINPDSITHSSLHGLKERLSTAGEAAKTWLREAVAHVGRPAAPPLPAAPSRPGSVQGYAARFLADWCSQPERSQLAVALGGGPLLDWLVDAATDCTPEQGGWGAADVAEQEQAQRALAYLLQSDATAALVTERLGAVPRLLRHCQAHAQPPGAAHAADASQPTELLLQALQQRAAAGLTGSLSLADTPQAEAADRTDRSGRSEGEAVEAGEGSIAGMMHWILGGGGGAGDAGGLMRGEAFLSDLEDVMAMLIQDPSAMGDLDEAQQLSPGRAVIAQLTKQGQAIPEPSLTGHGSSEGLAVQRLAAAWLATWAEAHQSNRDKLTELNVAAAITHVASHVSGRVASEDARALQLQLIRLVAALAQGPASLSAFVRGGHDLPTTTSLFQPLTPGPSAPLIADAPSPATAQYHLAGCLQPLLYITADAAVEQDRARAVAALAALRAVLVQGGLPVAAVAAEEPLLPLLQKIAQGTGHWDVRGAAVRVLAAMAHSPHSLGDTPAVAQQVTAWRDWLLATLCQDKQGPQHDALRRDCCEALAELAALPGVTGLQVTHYWLAALLASLATRVWPFNAVVYTGPRDQVILPKAPQPGASAAQSAAPKAGPPATLPAGTPIDARDFLDAVPVLPSHIASVAAALEEASAAVVEEHELPLDFDPGSAEAPGPLARAFYRRVARTVDVMVAEQRVCQALEVLNALVAADPTKQQWLLSVGVLPLLYRLCNPKDLEAQPGSTQAADLALASRSASGKAGDEASTAGEQASGLAQSGLGRSFANAAAATGKGIASFITGMLPASLKRTAQDRAVDGAVGSNAAGGAAGKGITSSAGEAGQVEGGAGEPQEAEGVESDVNNDHEGPSHLCLRRQVARLLALLAVQPAARGQVGGPQWLPWLQQAMQDADCRLASHATRALLNLAAFRPRTSEGDGAPVSPRHRHPGRPARDAPAPPAPVYLDQIHLLNPGAPHLWTLALQGSRPHSQQVLQRANPQAAEPAILPADLLTIAPASALGLRPQPATASLASSMVDGSSSNGMPGAVNSSSADSSSANGSSASSSWAGALVGPASSMITSATSGAMLLLSSATSSALHMAASTLALPSSASAGVAPASLQLATALMGGVGDSYHPAAPPSPALPPGAPPGWRVGFDGAATSDQGDSLSAGLPMGVQVGVSSNTDPLQWQGAPGEADCCPGGVARHPFLQYAPFTSSNSSTAGWAAPAQAAGGAVSWQHGDQPPAAHQQLQQQLEAYAEAPLIDVVFVHGIRGGPFITWRKPGTAVKGSPSRRSAAFLMQSDCWPSDWLPRDAPRARLITVEYLAPVSGWEGESLPLEATVERVMGQLQAAGVGQRPLVFVAHSMGGLLVKEMLVRSVRAAEEVKAAHASTPSAPGGVHVAPTSEAQACVDRAQLAQATQGVVFFATPHFGSGMAAMGWKLRHMPYAAPAPALAQLTPGPHLVELNEALRSLAESKGLHVVSGVEGKPTQLSPVIPKILIVPEASAYPGFGELLILPNDDHISLCKPVNRQAPAYEAVIGVIRSVMQEAAAAEAG